MLPYRRAAVGSTNPAKLDAVRRALARLAPGCAVEGYRVDPGVGHQPIGDAETRAGADTRARAALAASGADVAFGLEGGALLEEGRAWLISWVAALTPDGRVGYASGLRMPLPAAVPERLRAGEELADVIDGLFGVRDARSGAGAIGLLTAGVVSRSGAFADLVAMALAPHLHPDKY